MVSHCDHCKKKTGHALEGELWVFPDIVCPVSNSGRHLVTTEGSYIKEPGPADPWAHQSEGMKCRTCMWFVEKKAELGRCRRHAPTMNGYPAVYNNDWCGDHKLDENKLSV